MATPVKVDAQIRIGNFMLSGPVSRPGRLPRSPGNFVVLDVDRNGRMQGVALGTSTDLRKAASSRSARRQWAGRCRGAMMFAFIDLEKFTRTTGLAGSFIMEDLEAAMEEER